MILPVMDTLWAPWRIGYIKGEKPKGCIFCQILAQHDDAANYVLHRGAHCLVMLNLYPYNNGHLMVVPYAHLDSVEQLAEDATAELMALTRRALAALRVAMRPTGFNIGINQGTPAGAGVADHVHQHVVPRWIGDTNFMPVLGETRVMPQSLESCYALLAPLFAETAPSHR